MDVSAKDANLVAVAELIGDPSRAVMLDALMDRTVLPAGELARRAGISPQTASAHLARLVEGGLLLCTTQGRHRLYTLASPEVAHALESLAVIAPPANVHSLREAVIAEQIHKARTCYDHLAGQLGVGLTQAMQNMGILYLEEPKRCYAVTETGAAFLAEFGIDLAALRKLRRAFALPCMDWSERRYHLAGALGAAFTARLFRLGWIEKRSSGRITYLTESGQQQLKRLFGEYV